MDFSQFLKPLAMGELTRRVSKAMSVNRSQRPGAEVLSTPALVGLLERASIRACDPSLPPGFTTVGYYVEVKHLAPTPVGRRVTARSRLVAVEGNKLSFQVEAYDDANRKVGEGLHRRAIVPLR